MLGLDVPDGSGPEVIRQVRQISAVPILALSVRDDDDAIAEAFDNGADDYLRQPFEIPELLARVRGVLRRACRERGEPPPFISGDLEVDLIRRTVWSLGREVVLSTKLYKVLQVLIEASGRVLKHEEILTMVWGARRVEGLQSLRRAVGDLRRRIEADPTKPMHILTVRHIGYRLRVLGRAHHCDFDPDRSSL